MSARRGRKTGELERRGIAPHAVDFIQCFLQFAAERVGLARRLLQDSVDGLHGGVGALQERGEARSSGLQDAAQYLALGLHLSAQVLQLARLLHARGDVGYAHQPCARLAGKIDGVEFEAIVGRVGRALRARQPDLDILQWIRSPGAVRRG